MVMKPDQFNFIMVIVYQMILIRLGDRAHEIVTTNCRQTSATKGVQEKSESEDVGV